MEQPMLPTCWPKRTLLLAGMAGALVLPCLPEQAPAREEARLSVADFEKLHRMLKPQPGESRWMEVPWYPNVWEARQKAAREGKPIFLMAGSGGAPPAGC